MVPSSFGLFYTSFFLKNIPAMATINFIVFQTNEVIFAAPSTTWRTSARHQRFLGFLMAQSHPPAFFSDAIFSRMMDRLFFTKSSMICFFV